MGNLLERLTINASGPFGPEPAHDALRRQVEALFSVLGNLYGPDRLVLKAGKLEALQLMRSGHLGEQVLALQRLVNEDPTLEELPGPARIPEILDQIEDHVADLIARRSVEERIEKKLNERMQQRHEDYLRELRQQILKEDAGPENAQTLKRYAILEKMETRRLATSALDVLRPKSLAEVVGQEQAIAALLTRLASPFPQHVLLYGPPGVGKTTVARLVMEETKHRAHTPFHSDAPFVEVDGSTLRWDPREVTNPLLGSVHDPIYQGARRDLAEGGVPEPKPGLVTEAHGGVLFIDEVGELDLMLQNKLLKVLEDKRVRFDSSYYDPADTAIPKYIKKLFEEGAPADFVLIGATTRSPEEINPALRSRCTEVFFEPLSPGQIATIVDGAAAKLQATLQPGVAQQIAEYTTEGRKAAGLVADCYGAALERLHRQGDLPAAEVEKAGGLPPVPIALADLAEVLQARRLSPTRTRRGSDAPQVGKVFGLGVYGYLGSVLEIEAVAFAAREQGKGSLRFNDAAGSMYKDSIFNAASVLRRVANLDLADYDVHCNVVGGGRIDGPSAGAAIFVAVYSALTGRPVRQDTGVSGELSVQGAVRPVGGIVEKIYGARRAGLTRVILPAENRPDLPANLHGLEVLLTEDIERVIDWATASPAQATE